MDSKSWRLDLIRERHRKLILEARGQIEYPVREEWDEEPFFDDEEMAQKFVGRDEPGDGDE